MNEKPSKWKVFTAGIIRENPVLRLVLGCCSALAVTTTVSGAVGMGLAMTFVLVCSNIVIIATFVTVVQMVLQAFVPDLYKALGVYLALIVVNCIILGRAEAFASKNGVLDSALDGLGIGLGFTLSLTLLGAVRELLGAGAIFGHKLIAGDGMLVFILAPGAFIALAYLMTIFNKLTAKHKQG